MRHREERPEGRHGRSTQRSPQRGADASPFGGPLTTEKVRHLQRTAGNGATTVAVQREGLSGVMPDFDDEDEKIGGGDVAGPDWKSSGLEDPVTGGAATVAGGLAAAERPPLTGLGGAAAAADGVGGALAHLDPDQKAYMGTTRASMSLFNAIHARMPRAATKNKSLEFKSKGGVEIGDLVGSGEKKKYKNVSEVTQTRFQGAKPGRKLIYLAKMGLLGLPQKALTRVARGMGEKLDEEDRKKLQMDAGHSAWKPKQNYWERKKEAKAKAQARARMFEQLEDEHRTEE